MSAWTSDNIDHNPSSTTSAESFHGTAISLFQARTTMDDGQKRDIPVVPSGHRKISLPVEYTTIMPLTAGMRCPLPERPETTFRPNVFLCMEEVFAPRHRMHGRAAGQPIPTFADGYQV